jgi:hypothetical protein
VINGIARYCARLHGDTVKPARNPARSLSQPMVAQTVVRGDPGTLQQRTVELDSEFRFSDDAQQQKNLALSHTAKEAMFFLEETFGVNTSGKNL